MVASTPKSPPRKLSKLALKVPTPKRTGQLNLDTHNTLVRESFQKIITLSWSRSCKHGKCTIIHAYSYMVSATPANCLIAVWGIIISYPWLCPGPGAWQW